jgi:putative hydrolase of the HAD superfamily
MIFFDAAGTLIEVRGSVGEIYARLANEHEISVDPVKLQAAFLASFRRQPPMACSSDLTPTERDKCERDWWRHLVREVFGKAGEHPQFEEFFEIVYEYFAQPEAWHVYPDVVSTLKALRRRGLRLAVISNFDSRLESLLDRLALREHFDRIHLSTHLGAAKPDPRIFHSALQAHGVEASAATHIGDSLREDVDGARAAGIRAIWLDRSETSSQNEGLIRITRLDQILNLI